MRKSHLRVHFSFKKFPEVLLSTHSSGGDEKNGRRKMEMMGRNGRRKGRRE
jgi:hypothetical protein